MSINLERLRNRVEIKYEDFRNYILSLCPEDIYALHTRITVVEDARRFFRSKGILTDNDINFFLNFKNPLDVLATEWERCLEDDSNDDLLDVTHELMGRDDLGDEYSTVEKDAVERSKIASSAPETACACEVCQLVRMLADMKGCEN